MSMAERIQPLDIIRITEAVKATLIIHYHAPYTDALEVQIVPDTILSSSVHNYGATNEYTFLPEKEEDNHTILELYKYDMPEGVHLDCSFKVATSDIVGKFKVTKQFVSDFMPLQKVISEYNDMLITGNEAINCIATEIQRQSYSAESNNAENKVPKILGKIDLSAYDKLKKDS